MSYIETDYDKLLYTNGLIMLKRYWIKKVAFGNKYYEMIKQKLGFFGLIDVQNTVPTLKHAGGSMMFLVAIAQGGQDNYNKRNNEI